MQSPLLSHYLFMSHFRIRSFVSVCLLLSMLAGSAFFYLASADGVIPRANLAVEYMFNS